MKIIYTSNFTLAKLPAAMSFLVGGSKTFNVNYAANGFALIGCTGSVTVEASNDDFASTVYSSIQTGSVVVDLAGTITAEKWRVTANAGGATLQYLYVGDLITIQEPSYPYSFEETVLSRDRQTIAGIKYSKIYAQFRAGIFSFKNVDKTELSDWQDWYNKTDGFRKGFVFNEPLTNLPVIITATASAFPLVYQRPTLLSGQIAAQEML